MMKDKREKRTNRSAQRFGAEKLGLKRKILVMEDQQVDYRDYELLRKFMTERGKITPGRITGSTAKQQRQVKRAIRRARVMGLLP